MHKNQSKKKEMKTNNWLLNGYIWLKLFLPPVIKFLVYQQLHVQKFSIKDVKALAISCKCVLISSLLWTRGSWHCNVTMWQNFKVIVNLIHTNKYLIGPMLDKTTKSSIVGNFYNFFCLFSTFYGTKSHDNLQRFRMRKFSVVFRPSIRILQPQKRQILGLSANATSLPKILFLVNTSL